MNRRTVPRRIAPLAAVVVCLVLSCVQHHREAPKTSSPPSVTGGLADVDCNGLSPATLAAEMAEAAPPPHADAVEAWLTDAVEGDVVTARLRTYLHCLAERGAEGSSGSERSP